MPNENEIRVALTADYSNLQSGMDAGADVVKSDSAAMGDAAEKAGEAVSAAAKAIGESAQEAASRIQAMVKESLAQQEAMNATARATVESAAATDAMAAASGRATKSIAETVAAQNAQMVQMSEFIGAEATAATAAEATTVATNEQTAATGRLGVMTGAVAREMGVLAGEAARGNWTRLEGSTITLANRMDLLQYAFSATGLAAIGAGALVYEFGKAVLDGERQSEQFNKTLIATGGYLGVTQGEFDGMAASLVSLDVTAGQSREALMRFAESGRFSGEELHQAAQMAADMATVTGQSMDKCVEAIVKLQENPVKAIQQLDEQYHFLTLSQLDEIEQLEKQGDAQGAAAEAMKAYADTMHERAQQVADNLGTLDRVIKTVREDASLMWDAISGIGRKATLDDQYDQLLRDYTNFQDHIADAQKLGDNDALKVWVAKAEEAKAQMAKLRGDMQGESAAAQAEAERQRTQQEGKDAARKYDADFGGLDKQQLRLQKTIELENQLAAIHKANPNDQRVQGIEFDPFSGAVVGGERLAELLAEIDKKYQDMDTTTRAQRAADAEARREQREAGKEAKEEAAGEMNQLAQKRAQTQQYSQQRLQLDEQIVERAKELYGEDSSRYTAAVRQKETDTREFNNRARSLAVQKMEADRQAQDGEIDNQRRSAELKYQEGQITAQQLLDIERRLITQKLALDLQYLQAKRRLDQQDVLAQQKDDQEILKAKQRANTALLQADRQYQTNTQREWANTARRIESSIGGAFSSMLFQGQTLQSGMVNIAESIAQAFISKAIDWAAESIAQTIFANESNTQVTGGAARANIAADAASAAAGAFSATAAIPFVGPMIAPGAAAAAYAQTMAWQASVPSAAGGWDKVPADVMANIHKDEMVLPASIADPLRNMIAASGTAAQASGGGSTTIHLHAADARSFDQWLRRGGGAAIARYAAGAGKNSPLTRS